MIFWSTWTRTVRNLARGHASISCTLLLIYMRSGLNIKCLWQHLATNKQLGITKFEWSQVCDPIVIRADSLRQLQPGQWKIPIKPRTEELTNLLSALQEFRGVPHFNNTHPITKHLVNELFLQSQSSVSDDQATSPKRNKTHYKYSNSMVEVSYLWNFNLALFWLHRFYFSILCKNLDVISLIVELQL